MLSYARAASEPPKPIKSGIFNPPKSIILPVEEENENRHDLVSQSSENEANKKNKSRKKDHSDHLNQ